MAEIRNWIFIANPHQFRMHDFIRDYGFVEYRQKNKVQLGDIIIVGYVVGYQEFEARVKVPIWDQTGVVDVTFFNQNENQDSSGLSNFYYEQGKKKPVKIFGTVKVYKKEKNLQGAKIIGVTDNEVTFHILEVINAWLYLTGQLEMIWIVQE